MSFEYFSICDQCIKHLFDKDPMLAGIYKSVCETYVAGFNPTHTPHMSKRNMITKKDIAFLEKKGYIVSTEKNLTDLYLKPLGHKIDFDLHTFCIKRAIHKTIN